MTELASAGAAGIWMYIGFTLGSIVGAAVGFFIGIMWPRGPQRGMLIS